MRFNPKTMFLASIAITSGVVVLLGYFIELPLLVSLRVLLLRWAVILSAVALVAGVINLAHVHWRKLTHRQPGALYSLVLLISFLLTLVIVGFWGPTARLSIWLYNFIQVPVESSLMAVLAVVLAYAIARLLYRRINLFTLIFVGTVVLVLVGMVSLPGFEVPGLRELRSWLVQVWATAGARGILLGVALGTVATGLRILVGADRPYGG